MIILHVCIYKNYLDISIIIYWYFDRCYNILSIYQVIMIHFHITILILKKKHLKDYACVDF